MGVAQSPSGASEKHSEPNGSQLSELPDASCIGQRHPKCELPPFDGLFHELFRRLAQRQGLLDEDLAQAVHSGLSQRYWYFQIVYFETKKTPESWPAVGGKSWPSGYGLYFRCWNGFHLRCTPL